MSWWTSIAGLSALIAYDASHLESPTVLTDLSGGGNHADMGTQEVGPAAIGLQSTAVCVLGKGLGWHYNRVNRPTSGVLMALVANVAPRVMLFSDFQSPGGTYHALLIETDVTNLSPYGQIRCEGYGTSVGLPSGDCLKFVAIVFDATGYRYYYNGGWLGGRFASPLYLLSSVGSDWPNSWGLNGNLLALGMFAGMADLADMQNLEAQTRGAIVYGPSLGAHGFGVDVSRVNTIAESNLSTQALGDGTGRANTAPMQALDGLGVRSFLLQPIMGTHDIHFGGLGQVVGTVKNTPATPVRRRVLLMNEATRVVIRETWSDAVTGAYSFTRIAMDASYTVVSYDHTHAFRAVVADRVTPELMVEYKS